MLKYVAFRVASLIFPHIPPAIGYLIAGFLAELAYLLASGPRRTVRDNMRHVLGADADSRQLRHAVRGVFHNTARNYYELICLKRLDLARLQKNLTVVGWEYLQGFLDEGRGVIIATAHLGNVDLVVQLLAARSVPLIVLAEPLEPPALFRLVKGLRESLGLSFLPVGFSSLKTAIQALKQGGVVAVACDRDVLGKGEQMNFFGEDAILPTGAVDLALKTGAAIIPAFSSRLSHGRFEIHAEPPIILNGSRNGEQIKEANEKIIYSIEKHIRLHPEQWVVFERVWDQKLGAGIN